MVIREPVRNGEQNALLHAAISDVAEQLQWAGEKRDKETWKRLLVAAWMRATGRRVTLLPSIDGNGFDALYARTSRLTKAECSELCDFIFAWGSDNGVRFSAPEEG
jgi:hypothetical protein